MGHYSPKYDLVLPSTPTLPLSTALPLHRTSVQYQTLLNFHPSRPLLRKANKVAGNPLMYARRASSHHKPEERRPTVSGSSPSPLQASRSPEVRKLEINEEEEGADMRWKEARLTLQHTVMQQAGGKQVPGEALRNIKTCYGGGGRPA